MSPATAKAAAKPHADEADGARRALEQPQLRRLTLHGHRIAYRQAGSGPALVLIHGITSSSATWERVMPYLARHFTVIAPDLVGHGESDKPRGDYSLGAHASSIRDLLLVLGHERASVVGHSLGGGIAMQFAYQFPERCERLVLVDSGGLGRDVNVLLRAATLPGAEFVLPLLAATRAARRRPARRAACSASVGLRARTDIEEIARGHATLSDAEARAAFVHTLRSVVEPGGQRVDASNRLYLSAHIPFLLVWGEHDSVIPVAHGRAAHEHVPGSRLEVFASSGHFPQLDEPHRFIDVLVDFLDVDRAGDARRRALARAARPALASGFARRRAGRAVRRASGPRVAPGQSGRTSSTTLPVARRSSMQRSASAARLEREALADDRTHEALVDQPVDDRADLAVDLRAGHHVGAPAGADDLGVAEQQAVDFDLGDRAAGEADDDEPPVLAQRAQAVGEAIAADGVEHDVDAAAGAAP